MLLLGSHNPLKLLIQIYYYFQLTYTPRDYPLTLFTPVQPNSPVK